ncbi:MAG: hypothetical protein H0U39_11800 [Segetibacter sp.]|jgi:hypothetical protein|nr:hypothetical protein [Segetibacter sp.]
MGATIVRIKVDKKTAQKKPLSPLQKKLLEGPVMSHEEYNEYKKNNKWMGKWKV